MKYKPNDFEVKRNIIDSIYDTLAGNGQYPQFNSKNIEDGFVGSGTGEIEFNYQLNEIYKDGISLPIKPKSYNIHFIVDILPNE